MGTLFEVNKDEGNVAEVYPTVENIINVTFGAFTQIDDWNPPGLQDATLIRVTLTDNQDISGIVAPPAGVNKIIKIARVDTVDSDEFWFDHNDDSAAANRFMLRDNDWAELKCGETASFWYDHLSERWRPLNRLG
jgi:hypothetical protein